MNFTPAQGVTPANEVTWKHYELFLAAEGTSPSDTGPAEERGVS